MKSTGRSSDEWGRPSDSDVVASRPRSLRRELPAAPLVAPTMVSESSNARYPSTYEGDASERKNNSDFEERVLTEEIETPDKIEGSHWTTVVRRRARESFEKRYRIRTLLLLSRLRLLIRPLPA